MKLVPEIVQAQKELSEWRRDIHAHPELGFDETRTAHFVAEQLTRWGIDVVTGIGKTGVVGTLKVGNGNKTIGLRADMDALPMDETNDFAHKSKHPGCKHGCGHDGHTVMLLAAARYLAQNRNFDGTVQFIFQPAEEANAQGSGARAMINDGLFERFPMDCIFGMHNVPEAYLGAMAASPGLIAASMDLFEVTIKGKGAHGAQPHEGNDPIMVAAQLLTAWQTIVSRNISPTETVVLSACSVEAGKGWNVIPESAVIRGNIRAFSPTLRAEVKQRFQTLTQHIAAAFDVSVTIDLQEHASYPCCINDPQQTEFVWDVAETIFGHHCVQKSMPPDTGSEDFSFLLEQCPGCYMVIGTAPLPEGESGAFTGHNINHDSAPFIAADAIALHHPAYDFNDDAIPIGATVFVRLAERYLHL